MTIKTARQQIATTVASWLASPPAEYPLDDSLIEIHRYTTAPDPNNNLPFQIVMGTERTAVTSEGVDESEIIGNLYLALFARIDMGEEATKEAAEDWLDDCEAYLVEQLEASRNQPTYRRIKILGVRRDPDRQWFGLYRVSYIRLGVELR